MELAVTGAVAEKPADPPTASSAEVGEDNPYDLADVRSAASAGESTAVVVPPPVQNVQVCPTCSVSVSRDAVVCTRCGYNFKTRKRMGTQIKGPGPDGKDVAVVAGKVVLSMVAGGVAAVLCAVAWLVVIHLTGFEIGYMAVGVGLATGGAMRLVNPNGGTVSGLAGAGFAFLSMALVKGVLCLGAAMLGLGLLKVFGPYDFLWVALAISSAWRLAKG